MIIFLSDLHLCDGTAGPGNVSSRAFAGTFKTLSEMANDAGAKELTIVFLGDTFDLIRTAEWQKVEADQRPWGRTPSLQKAREFLETIIKMNEKSFAIMRGDDEETSFKGINVRRIYIPGNHDRMVDMDPEMREIAAKTLGINRDKNERFPRFFADPEVHRTFARHGHEFDEFNFEGVDFFRSDDWIEPALSVYDDVPIGDIISAEFASALPGAVLNHISDIPQHKGDRARLETRLKDLFDVRPMTAIPAFLAYQIHCFEGGDFGDAIIEGVRDRCDAFLKIPRVRAWMDKHDTLCPIDAADKLQILLRLLRLINFGMAQNASPLLERLQGHGDNEASDAAREFVRLDKHYGKGKMLYVLYGHTHKPDQVLIDVVGTGDDEWGRLYLNTGMWRPAQHKGVTDGFTSIKHITCSIIYAPDEKASKHQDQAKYPSMEVWTGALKHD
jgi:UDP-2,3-diacylglucosamine pyrophosphatase LpxH